MLVGCVAIHDCWLKLRRQPRESQEIPHGRLVEVDGGVRVGRGLREAGHVVGESVGYVPSLLSHVNGEGVVGLSLAQYGMKI